MLRTKRTVNAVLALVLSAGFVFGGVVAKRALASPARTISTLTISFYQEPDSLWPGITGSRSVGQILTSVVDTMVYLSPKGKVTPDLATKWTISNHAKTYRFYLRKGVTFQDGTPFNAQAVVDNWNWEVDPSTGSKSAIGDLGPYASSRAVSKYVVQVNFSQPYAAFLPRLGTSVMGFQSPQSIAAYKSNPSTLPVTTGPFQIISFTPNQSVVLQRNARYNWAPALLKHKGPAKLSKVVFHIVAEAQSRIAELESGQAQLADGIPGAYFKQYKSSSQYAESALPLSGVGIWAVLNEHKFPTNIKAVREAIMYDVNRPAVVQLADDGVFPVTWGPIQKGTLGYFPEFNSYYHYSPAKANQIMKRAGWKKVGGIWTKSGKKAVIDLTSIANNADYPALAQAIQGDLQQAGFGTTFEQYAIPAWVDNNAKGNENITPLQWTDVDPDALRVLFTPGHPFSWCNYNNSKFSALVNKAAGISSMKARLVLYKQAEKMLMNDAVLMPLHWNADLVLMSRGVKNFQTYASGGFVLINTTVS